MSILLVVLIGFVLFLTAATNIPRATSTALPTPAIPPPNFWTSNHDRIEGLSAIITGLFTAALFITSLLQWSTIKHQADIMEAQFDQWIDFANWSCTDKPRDGKLHVSAELINSTGFPVIFSGSVKVGEESISFTEEFLSPRYSKLLGFDVLVTIPVTGEPRYTILPPVTAHLIFVRNRIIKKKIIATWEGSVQYSHWQSDGNWHFTAAHISTRTKSMP
jgi:hypothetical protein